MKECWTTSESVTFSRLRSHLCDLGDKTNGGACKDCPSQCAFGKRYIGPRTKEAASTPVTRMLRVYMPDGSLVGEWRALSEAKQVLNVGPATRIQACRPEGHKYRGMKWIWEDI